MKIGVDSYCYHRFFGELYPGLQKAPAKRMSVWDFLRRARQLKVEGVSIEAHYLEPIDDALLSRLRDRLDAYHLDRVWAWGHPAGLKSGTDRDAARDLIRHVGFAKKLGARVMRIVGGSRKTRPKSWAQHRRRLGSMLRSVLGAAEDHGVILAIENHVDLLSEEMVELLSGIDSPWLGVCLDTGNNLRMFEDPLVVVERLAPWTRATHIKDLTATPGDPKQFHFWASVPLGQGLVDIAQVIKLLKKARYRGLLAIEIDYLHPKYADEDRVVGQSVRYLRRLLGR